MPLMALPVRTTIVTIAHQNILISPGSQLNLEDYNSMPNITAIIAPNLFHCAGVEKAAKHFPNASKWGPPGVKEKFSALHWDQYLNNSKWLFDPDLNLIPILGMPKINEMIFYHKSSKSLIVTDLCFNLIDANGFGAWLILSLFGTYQKFGISRFFLKYVEDPIAFKSSIQNLFDFDFDHIILSHGQNIIGNAKAHLQKALKERNFEF